jgi:hypothetical protein
LGVLRAEYVATPGMTVIAIEAEQKTRPLSSGK